MKSSTAQPGYRKSRTNWQRADSGPGMSTLYGSATATARPPDSPRTQWRTTLLKDSWGRKGAPHVRHRSGCAVAIAPTTRRSEQQAIESSSSAA